MYQATEPAATAVDATAAMFRRSGEASAAEPELEEAARLVNWMAPFLALAKVRVERRQDLASMVGEPGGA